MNTRSRFARWVFLIAAIYGVIVLLPQYFLEDKLGRDFPPALNHPEHFYGFIGVALAWQIAFLLIAHDAVRFRLFMIPAVLEKLSFGSAAIVLYFQDRVVLALMPFAMIDLVFAALFVVAFRLTGPVPARTERLDHCDST